MARVFIPSKCLTKASLPRICVVSGDRRDVIFEPVTYVRFRDPPPLLGALFPFIAMTWTLATPTSVRGVLPFARAALARWRLKKVVRVAALAAAFGCFWWSMRALGAANGMTAVVAMFLCAVCVAIGLGVAYAQGPTCVDIRGDLVELEIPSADAAAAIAARLSDSARS
jgi:hypothetical protein